MKADTEKNTLQHNTCEGAFAECSSSGVHLIDILASDQAVVEADSKQLLEQGNECIDAFCENSLGENVYGVTALDRSSVDAKAAQDVEQGNACDTTFCENFAGTNSFNVFTSG